MNGCNLEWSRTIHDFQWGPGLPAEGPSDLASVEESMQEQASTTYDPSPPMATVRATYDSRLINSYDFQKTAPLVAAQPNAIWTVGWQVPLGYRAVIRKFKVFFNGDVGGDPGNSVCAPLLTLYPTQFGSVFATGAQFASAGNGVAVPNCGYITIGSGDEFDCFFIVEEDSWFGLTGQNNNLNPSGSATTVSVNVYGTLIATNELELPYCVGNPVGMQA